MITSDTSVHLFCCFFYFVKYHHLFCLIKKTVHLVTEIQLILELLTGITRQNSVSNVFEIKQQFES